MLVGNVFLETTLKNIQANHGKISVSVYDSKNLEGYQIKGKAAYVTEGTVVDTFKSIVENMFPLMWFQEIHYLQAIFRPQ